MTALVGPLNHPFWWPWVPAMALSVGKVRGKHRSRPHGDPWGQKLPLGATLDDAGIQTHSTCSLHP